MTDTEISKTINLLVTNPPPEGHGRVLSPWHETYFRCYREMKNGTTQEVLVTIRDFGKDSKPRYVATAATEDGKQADAGDGESIELAIATIRWSGLDK